MWDEWDGWWDEAQPQAIRAWQRFGNAEAWTPARDVNLRGNWGFNHSFGVCLGQGVFEEEVVRDEMVMCTDTGGVLRGLRRFCHGPAGGRGHDRGGDGAPGSRGKKKKGKTFKRSGT